MKKFAVSYIDWFNHELATVIVEADSWQKALMMHPKVDGFAIDYTESLENVKEQFFDYDVMVECMEIEA